MDEQKTAKILFHVPNSGIVQMTGRRLPGIVIQGDSLSNWFDQVLFCLQRAKQHQDEEAYYELLMIAETVQNQLLNYETTLAKLGIDRPYSPSVRDRLVEDSFIDS